MNTWTATAAASIRTASVMSIATRSSDSSLRTDGPPEARSTSALGLAAGTTVRTMPRVAISASAHGASGTTLRSTRSSPRVGPWK